MGVPNLTLINGAKMPVLGLGTFLANDPENLEVALNTALELGYRHIDTAYVYENEGVIGRVVKEWIDTGKLKREDIFITTKLPPTGVHPDRVEYFIKRSLKNLQLGYVDLYLIHLPIGLKYTEEQEKPGLKPNGEFDFEGKTDHEALWKKMEEQVNAGRTRAIGLSNYSITQIDSILKVAKIKPANLQIEVHVFLQQNELINFCRKNEITVVAFSPLGNPSLSPLLELRGIKREKLPSVFDDPTISKVAKRHNVTNAQVALRFLIQRGLSVIPKSVTPFRIKENFEVFDFALDDQDMKELYSLHVGERARSVDFKITMKGIEEHPDFPFPL